MKVIIELGQNTKAGHSEPYFFRATTETGQLVAKDYYSTMEEAAKAGAALMSIAFAAMEKTVEAIEKAVEVVEKEEQPAVEEPQSTHTAEELMGILSPTQYVVQYLDLTETGISVEAGITVSAYDKIEAAAIARTELKHQLGADFQIIGVKS